MQTAENKIGENFEKRNLIPPPAFFQRIHAQRKVLHDIILGTTKIFYNFSQNNSLYSLDPLCLCLISFFYNSGPLLCFDKNLPKTH